MGGAASQQPGPRVLARAGQHVELACHALGGPNANANHALVQGLDTATRTEPNRLVNDKMPLGQLIGAGLPSPHGPHQSAPDDDNQDESASLHQDDLNGHLISLVFWYKDDNPAPIYTLDARHAVVPGALEPVPSLANDKPAASDRDHSKNLQQRQSHLNHNHKQQHEIIKSHNGSATAQPNGTTTTYHLANQVGQLNTRLLVAAKHYAAARTLGLVIDWPLIKLRLESVEARHSGDYKCRVDFRRARTIRQTVRLLVQGELNKSD